MLLQFAPIHSKLSWFRRFEQRFPIPAWITEKPPMSFPPLIVLLPNTLGTAKVPHRFLQLFPQHWKTNFFIFLGVLPPMTERLLLTFEPFKLSLPSWFLRFDGQFFNNEPISLQALSINTVSEGLHGIVSFQNVLKITFEIVIKSVPPILIITSRELDSSSWRVRKLECTWNCGLNPVRYRSAFYLNEQRHQNAVSPPPPRILNLPCDS